MPQLVNKIIQQQRHCYFLSPYIGDAAFWLGGIMTELSGRVSITVVNVFTAAESRLSREDKLIMKQAKIPSHARLSELRMAEDKASLEKIGARVLNLDLSVSGLEIEKNLIAELMKLLREQPNAYIFCPLAVSSSRENIMIKSACQKALASGQLVYWLDEFFSPVSQKKDRRFSGKNFKLEQVEVKDSRKADICAAYHLQPKLKIKPRTEFYRNEIFYSEKLSGRELTVKRHTALTPELRMAWQEFWQNSPEKNFFNSHDWFSTCQRTFSDQDGLILVCYSGMEIVGLLPLVKTKKYGVTCYASPGEQYLDKSTMLVERWDYDIFNALLQELKQLGSFYLSELPELFVATMGGHSSGFYPVKSSVGTNLDLSGDPHHEISTKEKKKIQKMLRLQNGEIRSELYQGGFANHLATVCEIESQSQKSLEMKDVVSNPLTKKLLLNLNSSLSQSLLTHVLYYGNEPVCFQLGFFYEGVCHCFQTAYKLRYKGSMPGVVLTYLLLEKLKALGISAIDFSRGDHEYKKAFTKHIYYQYDLFFSQNLFTLAWWRSLCWLKAQLEARPKIIAVARRGKNLSARLFKFNSIMQVNNEN